MGDESPIATTAVLTGDSKPVGGSVTELRFHRGPGYRVYCTRRGHELLILLAGGDKSSQTTDIKKTRRLARESTNGH